MKSKKTQKNNMKFKQEVEEALEVAENLALTLETVASTPRLSNPDEIKR